MNATQELFQLADTAAAARARWQKQPVREPLRVLRQVCDEVGRAWSGSNIGYHATVYYSGLQPKPPHVQFSAEWGLMDVWPTHQPDRGWEMMDYKDVKDYIVSRVGLDVEETGNALGQMRDEFINLKENAISILSTFLSTTPDSFLQRQFDVIEKLAVRHPQKIARQFITGGQVFSRDTTAMTQGFSLAPHQQLSAIPLSSMELEAALDNLEKATRLSAAHVARIEERQHPAMTTNTATTICIGHGRSPLWRELKEFLVERLHLTVDEFNSIPTAGIPITERLGEMLDAAAFAFLIMTGEDEQIDGKVHARLNVVHEAGLFQGRLGFRKAIILLEDGCEEFSNVHGLGHLPFPKGKISTQFEEIRRVLERERVIFPGQ